MDIQTVLEEIGIEKKEAKVYISLLKVHEATATRIAKETNLDRTLIYQLTNKLVEKGLVSYVTKNNIRYFIPSGPEKILYNIKDKERKIREILPELTRLTKIKGHETKAEVYRGKEGFRTILKDILATKKDFIVFGEEGRFKEVIPTDVDIFLKQLEVCHIKEKVLLKEGVKIVVHKPKNSEFRFLPKEYLTRTTTIVYGDKVVNCIWDEPYYAIVITNKDIANSYRGYFEVLWGISKR